VALCVHVLKPVDHDGSLSSARVSHKHHVVLVGDEGVQEVGEACGLHGGHKDGAVVTCVCVCVSVCVCVCLCVCVVHVCMHVLFVSVCVFCVRVHV
jgi:hypothetical protein